MRLLGGDHSKALAHGLVEGAFRVAQTFKARTGQLAQHGKCGADGAGNIPSSVLALGVRKGDNLILTLGHFCYPLLRIERGRQTTAGRSTGFLTSTTSGSMSRIMQYTTICPVRRRATKAHLPTSNTSHAVTKSATASCCAASTFARAYRAFAGSPATA